MKISQNQISALFLFLMTIIVVSVLSFYYLSTNNIVNNVSSLVLSNKTQNVQNIVKEESSNFFSHDILDLKYVNLMHHTILKYYSKDYRNLFLLTYLNI